MQSILNPDLIRAAATSTLGIFSLMCLIIGLIVLALFRNAPVWAKLLVFVPLLGVVFGFGSALLRQQAPPVAAAEASREFFVGRWQVEQADGDREGGTFTDYFDDGSFSGKGEVFLNGQGTREKIAGKWDFAKLAKDQFTLTLNFEDGRPQWKSKFRILDHDHIHNFEMNYVAVRMLR
jgi:hypothetical protein